MGTRKSYISFWVYTEVRMVPFVGEKWGDTGGSTRSIDVRELSQE